MKEFLVAVGIVATGFFIGTGFFKGSPEPQAVANAIPTIATGEHSILANPQTEDSNVVHLESGTLEYNINELQLEPIPAEEEDELTPDQILKAIPEQCRDYTSKYEGKEVAWEVTGGELTFITFQIGDGSSKITVSVREALPELWTVMHNKKFLLKGPISNVSEYTGDISFYGDVVLEEK